MTDAEQQELRRMREADDQWTAPKLLGLVVATLTVAFSVIYVISGFNGGH